MTPGCPDPVDRERYNGPVPPARSVTLRFLAAPTDAGYSGSGFCNGNNATSGYVQFTVSASAAGTATLGVRFANGTTTARPAALVVNGATAQTVSFEGTGAWNAWTTRRNAPRHSADPAAS